MRKITVSISQEALKKVKLAAIDRDVSYSDEAADRILRLQDALKGVKPGIVREKCVQEGIQPSKGRPGGDAWKGGSLKARVKTTLYFETDVHSVIQKICRKTGIGPSAAVELAIIWE